MNLSNGNILVTGGLGFLGSHFVDLLMEKDMGQNIAVLDAITYCGSQRNLEHHIRNEKLEIVNGSICDRTMVREAVRGTDVVVHFAAETHVDRSLSDMTPFYETNIMGTLNVLEACRIEGVEKVLVVSTDEVYGDCHELAVEEKSKFAPKSPYAVSKATADMSAMCLSSIHSLPVCIVRPVNNYGPRQYPEKLVPKFITRMLAGERVPIYGDGRNTREWLYVTDTCNAILSLLDNEEYATLAAGEAFNIGSGVERSVIEVTRMLSTILGVQDKSIMEYVDDRPGHVVRHRVDWTKLNRAVGWKPEIGFREGLERTVGWYRERYGEELREWWGKRTE